MIEEQDGIGWCSCGNAWFELHPYDDDDADPGIGAAVCVSPIGEITGYAGRLVCSDCGRDWSPQQRPLLTVIEGGKP